MKTTVNHIWEKLLLCPRRGRTQLGAGATVRVELLPRTDVGNQWCCDLDVRQSVWHQVVLLEDVRRSRVSNDSRY